MSKYLVAVLVVLSSSTSFANADFLCESGGFHKSYLIIDQSVFQPRDVTEYTRVTLVDAGQVSHFKNAGPLPWVSIEGDASSVAKIHLANSAQSGELVVGVKHRLLPKHCLRCTDGSSSYWAELEINDEVLSFTCKVAAPSTDF